MAEAAKRRVDPGLLRRLALAAGCAAGVLLLGFGLASGGRLLEARQAVFPAGTAATGARLQPAFLEKARQPEAGGSAPRAIDPGQSEGVPRDRVSGWQRLPPRPPLGPSPLAAATPEKAAPVVPAAPDPGLPRRTLLFGLVATAAVRIEAGGHVIELEGIRVIDPAEQCEGQGRRSWPCGAVARAAFRAWIRGRAAECTVTPLPLPKPVSSLCELGDKDMAAWLVSRGYAEAAAGGAYEQAGQEAKAARRGIFGTGPAAPAPPVAAEGIEEPPSLVQADQSGEAPPSEMPAGAGPAPQP